MNLLRRRPSVLLLLTAVLAAPACSDDPDAPGPNDQEVLLVVNSTDATLSIARVEAPPATATTIPLLGSTPTPVDVAARAGFAVVPLGLDNALSVVDLKAGGVARTVPLADGSGATGSAIVDDSIAYVANPGLNTVTRVNYLTGDTASVAVGRYPQGVAVARGLVYVIDGNLVEFTPVGPGALTVIDPATNARVDSIALAGPGNAQFAAATDDRLYVVSSGSFDDQTPRAKISVVDTRSRRLVDSIADLGVFPGAIAVDRDRHRLYVSSLALGLLVYDLDAKAFLRGVSNPVAGNYSSVVVDRAGRIYAIEYGDCAETPGLAHVIDPATLTETAVITLGKCASGGATAFVPPTIE